MITVSQAAAQVGVTGDTIRRLMKKGVIRKAPPDELPQGHGRQPTMGVYVADLFVIRETIANGNGHADPPDLAVVGATTTAEADEVEVILDKIAMLTKRLRKVMRARDAQVRAEARRDALQTLGEELVRNAGR